MMHEVPADYIPLEGGGAQALYTADLGASEQEDLQAKPGGRLADLEEERKLLRKMVRYLAAEIDPTE
jgi:hypothetical protein